MKRERKKKLNKLTCIEDVYTWQRQENIISSAQVYIFILKLEFLVFGLMCLGTSTRPVASYYYTQFIFTFMNYILVLTVSHSSDYPEYTSQMEWKPFKGIVVIL